MNNALAIVVAAVIGFGGGYFVFTPSTAEVPVEAVAVEPQAVVVEEAAPAPAAEPAPIVDAPAAETTPAPAGTEAAAAGAPTEEVK